MERYERYRKYKFSKAFDAKMETVTFNNLYASFNNGELVNVQIVYYRQENFIHIKRYDNPVFSLCVHLNQATIHSNIINLVLIEHNEQSVKIMFNTAEEKLFFLNEVQQYILTNNYYICS